MIPLFRVSPPSVSQLAPDPEAPATLWFAGEREQLQVATSTAGIGLDLSAEPAKLVATATQLRRLLRELEACGSVHAEPLQRYLEPVVSWRLRTRELPLDRPLVMGILNLTDDSFSGDGVGRDVGRALERAEALRGEGADLLDVGAESARADRPVLEADEEARIVGAVVAALVREGHTVSSDTYKAAVARAALEAGAEAVNDISGLTAGAGAAEEARRAAAGYVLNYSYSVPKRRPDSPPGYEDVVVETVGWLERRLAELRTLGLRPEAVVIDPGVAFGKTHHDHLQMLRRIGELRTFGQPVLLAHSRKNFIGSVTGRAPAERDLETHVASAMAFEQGVRLFRVHDVAGTRRALALAAAVATAAPGEFAPDAESWPWRAGASAVHMTTAMPDKEAPGGQRW